MNSQSPQLPLRLALEAEATFAQFVAGPNQAALAALKAAAADPAANWPLLFGGAGLGKTHLLNAVCHAADQAGRRAMLLTSALLEQVGPSVLAELDNIELIAIDDVDQLIGQRAWDEALFHRFNQQRQQGGSLVLASRTELAALAPALPDLKSRLGWGLALRLEPLDEAGRITVLKQRALGRGIELSDEVVAYLMRRTHRDVASLLGLLDRLEHVSLVEKRRVTVPFLREQFPELRNKA